MLVDLFLVFDRVYVILVQRVQIMSFLRIRICILFFYFQNLKSSRYLVNICWLNSIFVDVLVYFYLYFYIFMEVIILES